MTDSYSLLLYSPIEVMEKDGAFYTFDLWARELEKQADVAALTLVCPVKQHGNDKQNNERIDARVRIQPYKDLDEKGLGALVSTMDVVQVPGTSGWTDFRASRRLLSVARRAGKLTVLSVSSNRARTNWLNSSGKGFAKRLKSLIRYVDIRLTQSWLAHRADGITAVGKGVARLFRHLHSNIHVCTASWIRAADIIEHVPRAELAPLKLCMAARIEWMKGMHIGISAVKTLIEKDPVNLELTIIGEGPQKSDLQKRVTEADLFQVTSFLEPVGYPRPFLDVLGTMDILLITNLNDEQPRVLFDAISQGCIPICPDTAPYREFDLDGRLFYARGDAGDLCRAIRGLCDPGTRKALREKLTIIARRFTIDSMYETRTAWIKSMLLARR